MLNALSTGAWKAATATTARGSFQRSRHLVNNGTRQHRRWLSAVVSEPLEVDTPTTTTITLEKKESDENDLKNYLRPSEIVKKLDDYVVGQQDAKRAVAIALRNRWRRRNLPEDIKKEIMPKNVLLVGPTGE